MPSKIFVGVDDVAHLVKKGYVGVNGFAKTISKAYIGVDGKARLFYTGKSLYFKPHTTTEYGTAIATRDGNSLFMSVSGYAPKDIDAYFDLVDEKGDLYKVQAGTKIILSLRYEKSSNSITCLRLSDMNFNMTFYYQNRNVTDVEFTVNKESYLAFIAEVYPYGETNNYARLWVDRFEINGEKII